MSSIAIIGLGTLGIATAHLFKHHKLILFDFVQEQILNFREREQISWQRSPIFEFG